MLSTALRTQANFSNLLSPHHPTYILCPAQNHGQLPRPTKAPSLLQASPEDLHPPHKTSHCLFPWFTSQSNLWFSAFTEQPSLNPLNSDSYVSPRDSVAVPVTAVWTLSPPSGLGCTLHVHCYIPTSQNWGQCLKSANLGSLWAKPVFIFFENNKKEFSLSDISKRIASSQNSLWRSRSSNTQMSWAQL